MKIKVDYDVVIVGAGPTGLMLAIQLARANVDILIIDSKSATSDIIKATGISSATLESFDDLDAGAPFHKKGVFTHALNIYIEGKQKMHLPWLGIESRYPSYCLLGQNYVESFQEKNGISVPITVTGVERRLESHIEVTIFRGVQELLTNALAHAQATQIQVALDLAQDHVQATVEDNGSGFNVDEALGPANNTIGLKSLRERIEMLGGEIIIQSSLGQGTRIQFTIPIAEESY